MVGQIHFFFNLQSKQFFLRKVIHKFVSDIVTHHAKIVNINSLIWSSPQSSEVVLSLLPFYKCWHLKVNLEITFVEVHTVSGGARK